MNILDRRFKYVPAAKTDVRKTFARVRAEQKAKAEQEARNKEEAAQKTRPMRKVAA